MNINPYILLGIGTAFALLYACVIIFGWARTRANRRRIQQQKGIDMVPTWVLDPTITTAPRHIKTISLTNNTFVDAEGHNIDPLAYATCIAIGESPDYPQIQNGDLIFKDAHGNIRYVFTIPSLTDFR